MKTSAIAAILFLNMTIALGDPTLTDKRAIRNTQTNSGLIGGACLFFIVIDLIWYFSVIVLIVRPSMIPRNDSMKRNKIGAVVRMESLNCSTLQKRN